MSAFFFGPLARTDARPPANRSAREAKATLQRQLAFKSPPLTDEERRRHWLAVHEQRLRDEGEVGLFG